MKRKLTTIIFLTVTLIAFSQSRNIVRVESQVENTENSTAQFLKRKVAIARFSNETQYAKGLFYNKANDPIGKQALDILSSKLAASNKFILLERNDIDKAIAETDSTGRNNSENAHRIGADYLIIGSVTQFGRKNIGDVNAFSRSKTQIVEAAVNLRLIDVSTGQIIYAEEAKGESSITSKTVLGLGGQSDYDATLSDKAIDAAISKLVENIINNCMDRPWKAYIIAYDENGIIMSGGKSQGIRTGDTYDVMEKGKKVNNPQTGIQIELPGKIAGKVKVDFVGGDTPQNEFSMISFTEGSIDKTKLDQYFIKEKSK